MKNGFLSPKETCERTSLSRSQLDRMVKAGTFPAPVHLSPGRLGYHIDKVDRWIAGREGGGKGTEMFLLAGFLLGSGMLDGLPLP